MLKDMEDPFVAVARARLGAGWGRDLEYVPF